MIKLILISIAIIFSGGCAVSSTIQRASESKSYFEDAVFKGETKIINEDVKGVEKYRVFHQGATGFVSVQTVREEAEQRASEFCNRMGTLMKPIQETTSKPPHILGNFPRAEIIFSCIEKPLLSAPSTYEDPVYNRLTNLKKLLDDGVITKDEFDREKAKILDQQ